MSAVKGAQSPNHPAGASREEKLTMAVATIPVTARVEEALYTQIQEMARARGMSVAALLVTGMRELVVKNAALTAAAEAR